jgi:hypothetical protein
MSVTYSSAASISMRDNTVTIHGTLTCSVPVSITLSVAVTEYVKGTAVVAPAGDPNATACFGTLNWTATGKAVIGRWKPGDAQIVVLVSTLEYGGQDAGASGPIRLKGGP